MDDTKQQLNEEDLETVTGAGDVINNSFHSSFDESGSMIDDDDPPFKIIDETIIL